MRGRGAFESLACVRRQAVSARGASRPSRARRVPGSGSSCGRGPSSRSSLPLCSTRPATQKPCCVSMRRRGEGDGPVALGGRLRAAVRSRRAAGTRNPRDHRRVSSGGSHRRREVDELRAQHDGRRRGAGARRRRRGVRLRRRNGARRHDVERLVAARRHALHAGGRRRHPRGGHERRARPRPRRRSATRSSKARSRSTSSPPPTKPWRARRSAR